jgi:hypothetical protein
MSYVCSVWLLLDHGQLFLNLVKEGLPTTQNSLLALPDVRAEIS